MSLIQVLDLQIQNEKYDAVMILNSSDIESVWIETVTDECDIITEAEYVIVILLKNKNRYFIDGYRVEGKESPYFYTQDEVNRIGVLLMHRLLNMKTTKSSKHLN